MDNGDLLKKIILFFEGPSSYYQWKLDASRVNLIILTKLCLWAGIGGLWAVIGGRVYFES